MLINKKDTIHIIGIGGIGMSGIAEIMSEMGFIMYKAVILSKNSNNIDRLLTRKKIKVFIGHKASKCKIKLILFFFQLQLKIIILKF